jgi:hypothetical protein
VSYGFRPAERAALDAFAALPTRTISRRERGSSLWATQVVGGTQLGAFSGPGLLVAEGRLAPMLSGRKQDTQLAAPYGLDVGAECAREAFAMLGISLDCPVVVRRLDLAAELRFEDPGDGLRFLAAMAAIHLPRHHQRLERARQTGRPTSVAWLSGRNVALRVYDAGLRHDTGAPGIRVRLERQLRYRKRNERTPNHFPRDLSTLYLGPLERLIDAAPNISVLTAREAERALIDRYLAGQPSLAVTERLLGVIRIRELQQEEVVWHDPDTRAGRLREMRNEGIYLDDSPHSAPAIADVRPLLQALGAAWQ